MFEGVNKLPGWHEQAECQRHWNADLWWYDNPHNSDIQARQEAIFNTSIAMEYCEGCPVVNQCLEEGLKTENLHPGSIWGGLLYSERLKITTKRGYSRRYNEQWLRSGVERLRKQRQGIANGRKETNNSGNNSNVAMGMDNTSN